MIRIKYVVGNIIHIDYAKSKEREYSKIADAFFQYMKEQNITCNLISVKIIPDRKIKGKSKLIQLSSLVTYT
jgi:hypothetical protein